MLFHKIKYNLFLIIIALVFFGCSTDEKLSETSASGSSNSGTFYGSSEPDAYSDDTGTADSIAAESNYIYLSYDDSASTAGVELCKYYLNNQMLPQKSWARPWEFLNYESFNNNEITNIGRFNISMGLWEHINPLNSDSKIYDLGIHIQAPTITREERKNAVITLIVDVSGSMDESLLHDSEIGSVGTLLQAAKYGMKEMYNSLKAGDVVNIIQFSTEAGVVLENYQYSAGSDAFNSAIDSLTTIASTNLDAGINLGYDLALEYHDLTKINRVIILTDAYANTGQVDSARIANNITISNAEGIYFSGLGFGPNFQEVFLNDLTEKGKGAYFAIVTPQDAKRAFNDRFIALLNVAAKDVSFRLDFPDFLERSRSAAEESSTIKAEVTPTNFSYNTSQFFLESFKLKQNAAIDDTQAFKLTIEYKDPVSLEAKVETYEKSFSEILGLDTANIKDAHIVTLLPYLIREDVSHAEALSDLELNYTGYNSTISDEYRLLIQSWLDISK